MEAIMGEQEECAICGKEISDEEYVVHWGSCTECWDKHIAAYSDGPTPGPWEAGPVDMFGDVNITGPEDSRAIAAVISNLRPLGQIVANACLIRAAPDLLEALKPFANATAISFTHSDGDILMVLRYRSGEPTGACLNSLERARCVVAKASRLSPTGDAPPTQSKEPNP
jgi:hypothetical protein